MQKQIDDLFSDNFESALCVENACKESNIADSVKDVKLTYSFEKI